MNFSSLQDAEKCARYYWHRHINKTPVPEELSGDMAFGSAMHSGLQAMFEGDPAIEAFRQYWDVIKGKPYTYGRFDYAALAAMGPVFLERFQKMHLSRFKATSVETRLFGRVGEQELEGTPDFVGLYDGKMSVVDFKTSGGPYVKEKVYVNEQMPIYAYLAEQRLGVRVEQMAYIVFIKSQGRIQTITAPLSRETLKRKIANVQQQIAELGARTEYPQNTSSCLLNSRVCAYAGACHPELGGEKWRRL